MAHGYTDLILKCTDQAFANTILDLLRKDFDSLPNNFTGAPGEKDPAEGLRFEIRRYRLEALARVAGETKNRNALPLLRRMVENDGVAREYAVDAIGRIGDPQDFEYFIKRIKSDPKSRFNLHTFGPKAVDRILKEFNDNANPRTVRYTLLSSLIYMADRENAPRFLELANHQDRAVANAAALALARMARPGDEHILIELARSPHSNARLQAIPTMSKYWDDQFIQCLSEILRKDSNAIVRAEAARVLGVHKARLALKDIQVAAQSDESDEVRRAATDALAGLK